MKITVSPKSESRFPKTWDNYSGLINILSKDHEITLVGITKENDYKNVIDMRGKTNISQLIEILKKSDLIITNEGGVAHLSSYYQKKAIVTMTYPHQYRALRNTNINLFKPSIEDVLFHVNNLIL